MPSPLRHGLLNSSSYRYLHRTIGALVCIASMSATQALAIDVANEADWSTAMAAVGAAGAGSTVTINVTGGFTLTGSLATIQASNNSVTINIIGGGNNIDGASAFQGIVVQGTNAPTVTISNLSITNTIAEGGNGLSGQAGYFSNSLSYGSGGGGGGGLGAGGGLYVDTNANVTLNSVTFSNNIARGGGGGNGGAAQNTASDPVNGGNGGDGGAINNGGASGGGGAGGTGGHSSPLQGSDGSAGPTIGSGGGGGGGSGTTGGGYTSNNPGGTGNNGGGAGAQGGDGATNAGGGQPGADGADGGSGGAARGGAIFVASGATLVINDTPISGSVLTPGTGGTGGSGQGPANISGHNGGSGAASGQNLYVASNTTLSADAGTSPGGITYSGTISGTAGIVKAGAGTLALSAANDYAGTTSITGGTLQLSGGTNRLPVSTALSLSNNAILNLNGQNQTVASLSGASASASVALGSATLSVNQSTNTTFAGSIGGTGGVTKVGGGTLLLSGNDTYSGATTISAGTLQLSGGSAIGDSSAVTLANVASARLNLNGSTETIGSLAGGGNTGGNVLLGAGTLLVGNAANTTFSAGISGTGGLTKQGTGTLTLAGSSVAVNYAGATTILDGTLALSGSASLAQSSGVNLAIAPAAFDISSTTSGATIATLSGVANSSLVIGGKTLTFSNASGTFAGDITGVGGSLNLSAGTEILTGNSSYSGATTVGSAELNISADNNIGTSSLILLDHSTLTFSDSFTFNHAATVAGDPTFNVTSGNTVTIATVIADGGTPGDVVKTGAGTLNLLGSNTFSGGTFISAGKLGILTDASLGDSTGGVQINGGATLQALGDIGSSRSIVLNGSDASVIDTNGHTVVLSGIISDGAGPGVLEKVGSGTLSLIGVSTYSGGTIISVGTLVVPNDANLGATTGTVTLNGGTLEFSAAVTSPTSRNYVVGSSNGTIKVDASSTIASSITGTGHLTFMGLGGLTLTGNNNYTGGTTIEDGALLVGNGGTTGSIIGDVISGGATSNAGINFNRSDDITFGGNISGLGYVAQYGTGTLTLTGNNTYGGSTTVLSGKLAFASDANVGTGDIKIYSGTVLYNASFTSALNYQLSNGPLDTNGNTVVLTGNVFTMAGTNVAAGFGGLTKIGLGTLILAGSDTYLGPTLVSAGKLIANTTNASSAVTVASGATLGGTGTVGSTTIASGGIMAPGNSIGTLTVSGDLVLAAGSTYTAEISPSNSDEVHVSGAASLAGQLDILPISGDYTVGTQYSLIHSIGALNGTFFTVDITGGFGPAIVPTVTYGANDVFLNLTPASFVWGSVPGATDWNTGSNWASGAVPSTNDVAVFDTTTKSSVDITQPASVAGLQFNSGAPAYNFAISGTAGGPASLVVNGIGILDNSGNAPSFVVSGVSATNGGTLQFSNGALAGDANIEADAFGTVTFIGRSNAGTGAMVAGSGGVIDFSGTTGPGSDGKVSAGSIAGAGTFNLGANTLTVDANNSSTEFSGTITGTGGALVKTGSGTLLLTGTNTYTGVTTINAGTLEIGDANHASARVAGAVVVNAGGTLRGHGTIGGNVTDNGGAVSPGASIGTLTVSGNYVQDGGTFAAELSPTGGSRLNVSGTASVSGATLVLNFDPGAYTAGQTFTLLHSAGLTGAFDIVTETGLSSFWDLSVGTTATDTILTLTPTLIAPTTPITSNQMHAAVVLNNAFSTGTGDLSTVHDALLSLSTAQQRDALTQISGVIVTAEPILALDQTHSANSAVLAHAFALSEGLEGGIASAQSVIPLRVAFAGDLQNLKYLVAASGPVSTDTSRATVSGSNPQGFWLQAIGDWNSIHGNSNSPSWSSSGGGVLVGYDQRLNNGVRAGLAFGYGHANGKDSDDAASMTFNAYRLMAYASYENGPLIAAGTLDVARAQFDTGRSIALGGARRIADSSHDGTEISASAQAGYRFRMDGIVLTPFLSVDYVHLQQEGFMETGAGALNLAFAPNDFNSLQPEAGLRIGRAFALDDGTMIAPEAFAGLRYEILDDNADNSVLLADSVPAGSFLVQGVSLNRATAHVGGRIVVHTKAPLDLYAAYEAQLSGTQRTQTAGIGLRYQF